MDAGGCPRRVPRPDSPRVGLKLPKRRVSSEPDRRRWCPDSHGCVPETAAARAKPADYPAVSGDIGVVSPCDRSGHGVPSSRRQVRPANLAKQPTFALIAIATPALGIGANTAIFTVVTAVVLEPLPFPAGDRLVRITADLPGSGGGSDPASGARGGPWGGLQMSATAPITGLHDLVFRTASVAAAL